MYCCYLERPVKAKKKKMFGYHFEIQDGGHKHKVVVNLQNAITEKLIKGMTPIWCMFS